MLSTEPADFGANHLDANHEWISQEHGPQHAEAKLCIGLRIGGDATGIIIGGPGNQARAKLL